MADIGARFKIYGKTAAAWTSANPVPLDRELCIETDTRKGKVGDGSTAFNSLPYVWVVPGSSASFANLTVTGNNFFLQPATVARSTTTTLVTSDLLAVIITANSATAITLTLPTGTNVNTDLTTALGSNPANNTSFDWYLINTGSSAGAVTIAAATGHTIVGAATIAIGTSGHFRTRKTGVNTYVTYRLT